MATYLQCLGVDSGDSSPSALLFFENARYLVNAGDGLQRVCNEYRARLTKVGHIFLTRVHPDALGGLPGLLLTLNDMGVERVRLHGPPGLLAFFRATRHFMRVGMAMEIAEYPPHVVSGGGWTPVLRDEQLSMCAAVLSSDCAVPHTASAAAARAVPPPVTTRDDEPAHKKLCVDASTGDAKARPTASAAPASATATGLWGPAAVAAAATASAAQVTADAVACGRLSLTCFASRRGRAGASHPGNHLPGAAAAGVGANASGGSSGGGAAPDLYRAASLFPDADPVASACRCGSGAVCYVFRNTDVAGKFDAAKAAALGLMPGPLYAQLKAGQTVTATVWAPESDPLPAVPMPTAASAGAAAAAAAEPPAPAVPTPAPATGPGAGKAAAAAAAKAAKAAKQQQQAKQKAHAAARASGALPPPKPPRGSNGPMKLVQRTVRPADVVSPPVRGAAYAVVDCPSLAHVPSLVTHPLFQQFFPSSASSSSAAAASGAADANDASQPQPLLCVMHMTPQHVLESAAYLQWMARFGPATRHIVNNAHVAATRSTAAATASTAGSASASSASAAAAAATAAVSAGPAGAGAVFRASCLQTAKLALVDPLMFDSHEVRDRTLLHTPDRALPAYVTAAPSPIDRKAESAAAAKAAAAAAESAAAAAAAAIGSGSKDKSAAAARRLPTPEQLAAQQAQRDNDVRRRARLDRLLARTAQAVPAAVHAALPSGTAVVGADQMLRCMLGPANAVGFDVLDVEDWLWRDDFSADLKDCGLPGDLATVRAEVTKLLPASASTSATAASAASSAPMSVATPPALTPAAARKRMQRLSDASAVAVARGTLPSADAVLFLGTGSAIPSKFRNVTSLYLHVAPPNPLPATSAAAGMAYAFSLPPTPEGSVGGGGGLLIDAGEGTYGQLVRKLGTARADALVMGLRAVFVSHLHADHHLGLINIIARYNRLWRELRQRTNAPNRPYPPLLVLCPLSVRKWLEEFARCAFHHPDATDAKAAAAGMDVSADCPGDLCGCGDLRFRVVTNNHLMHASLYPVFAAADAAPSAVAPAPAPAPVSGVSFAPTRAASASAPAAGVAAATPMPGAATAATLAAGGVTIPPGYVLSATGKMVKPNPTKKVSSFHETSFSSASHVPPDATHSPQLHSAVRAYLARTLSLHDVFTVPVIHCTDAYALVCAKARQATAPAAAGAAPPSSPVTATATAAAADNTEWSFVFSGDTRPSDDLVRLGRGATLLVHEATLEETMHQEAVDKRHCTTREAMHVGHAMRAERILLTHFSQRYPKVPSFDDASLHGTGTPSAAKAGAGAGAAGAAGRTASLAAVSAAAAVLASPQSPFETSSSLPSVAFDLMCIPFCRLLQLPTLLPAVKYLFPDNSAGDDDDDVVGAVVRGDDDDDAEVADDSSDDEANRAAMAKAKAEYARRNSHQPRGSPAAAAAAAAATDSNGHGSGKKRKHSDAPATAAAK